MAKISNIKVGQTLWQIRRVKCGNTTVSRNCVYQVVVTEISSDLKSIKASWNSNPPRVFFEKDVRKLRVNEPKPKSTISGMPSY